MAEWTQTPVEHDPFSGTVDATATMQPYTPTIRDRIANWLLGQARASVEKERFVQGLTGSRGLGTTGMGLVDLTPAAPLLAYDEAPKGQGALAVGMSMVPGAPAAKALAKEAGAGIRAFHGSPHSFDRFDMSKIGTGEGAQAYGHGLYFAENEGVARGYKQQLAKDGFLTADNQVFDRNALQHMNMRTTLDKNGIDLDKTIERGQELMKTANEQTLPMLQHDVSLLTALKANGGIKPNAGSMYEVNINAHPDQFLDWDKPLSQQSPQVQEALRKNNLLNIPNDPKKDPNPFGPAIVTNYGTRTQSEGANALKESGIPGIKYLDAGSRGAGEGSRNYVVFDDSLINIIKKYGIAGLALLPPATAATVRQQMTPVEHDPFADQKS